MEKCFVCGERIPAGDSFVKYSLDDLDRELLSLGKARTMIYFHTNHFRIWYVLQRKRKMKWKNSSRL